MRRFVVLLAAVVVLLGSAVVMMRPAVIAQETTPTGMAALASHPIVGTWRFVWDFGAGPTISYGIFHADGTYIQEGFVGGPLHFGVWEPTGARTADLLNHNLYEWEGRVAEGEARLAMTVDEAGNAIDGAGVYVSHFTDDGTLEYAVALTMPGTRLEAAPVVPLETLIAETTVQATPAP